MQVGIHPVERKVENTWKRLPHAGGGPPVRKTDSLLIIWNCPTPVGVNPTTSGAWSKAAGLPRADGGLPTNS